MLILLFVLMISVYIYLIS